MRSLRTVSASAMIGDLEFGRKGRCHTGMWKRTGRYYLLVSEKLPPEIGLRNSATSET
jgi:hypothetical protein